MKVCSAYHTHSIFVSLHREPLWFVFTHSIFVQLWLLPPPSAPSEASQQSHSKPSFAAAFDEVCKYKSSLQTFDKIPSNHLLLQRRKRTMMKIRPKTIAALRIPTTKPTPPALLPGWELWFSSILTPTSLWQQNNNFITKQQLVAFDDDKMIGRLLTKFLNAAVHTLYIWYICIFVHLVY